MGWEEKSSEPVVEPAKVEPAVETPVVEPKVDSPIVEAPAVAPEAPKADEGQTATSDTSEPMVPRAVLGKVAKSIRERARSEAESYNERIRTLEEENQRLKTAPPATDWNGNGDSSSNTTEEIQKAAREAARIEFLTRQEFYGRRKYGKDYDDALLLVKSQNDPALVNRVLEAPNPADALIEEAVRLAEDLEFGTDPREREKNKQTALKSKWRKEWEVEMADKLGARKNQPTDVQNVRAAGGNDKANYVPDTWATSLPK